MFPFLSLVVAFNHPTVNFPSIGLNVVDRKKVLNGGMPTPNVKKKQGYPTQVAF